MPKHDVPMEFTRLTFKSGLNATVRKGEKWLDSTGIYPAHSVDGKQTAKLRIVGTVVLKRFKDLIDSDVFLTLIHDPQARNYSDLHKRMVESYPGRPQFMDEPAFSQDDLCTVVFFTIVDKGNSTEQ